MASCTVPVVAALTLASVSFGSEVSAADVTVTRSGSSDRVVVRLFDLAAVRRSFDVFARDRAGMTHGEQVAAWADFSRLAEAVIGNSPVGPFTFDDLIRGARGAAGPEVVATRGVAVRNRVAYDMQAVGYSARETADVVGGRISLRALVTARRMIAIGQGRDKAAAYLDREYTRTAALHDPLRDGRGVRPGPFDALIQRYANDHDVEPAIVRAIIAAESAFDPASRSRAGAIGLMQLMPLTAQELESTRSCRSRTSKEASGTSPSSSSGSVGSSWRWWPITQGPDSPSATSAVR